MGDFKTKLNTKPPSYLYGSKIFSKTEYVHTTRHNSSPTYIYPERPQTPPPQCELWSSLRQMTQNDLDTSEVTEEVAINKQPKHPES